VVSVRFGGEQTFATATSTIFSLHSRALACSLESSSRITLSYVDTAASTFVSAWAEPSIRAIKPFASALSAPEPEISSDDPRFDIHRKYAQKKRQLHRGTTRMRQKVKALAGSWPSPVLTERSQTTPPRYTEAIVSDSAKKKATYDFPEKVFWRRHVTGELLFANITSVVIHELKRFAPRAHRRLAAQLSR
jgi:hypothetical protein